MPIPIYFVNGPRQVNPPGGVLLCELNPPFTQHQTLEILVHCPPATSELRHMTDRNETRQMIICANGDTIYLTVEPLDRLQLYLLELGASTYVQGSLYVF